jgi:hypothetical protein
MDIAFGVAEGAADEHGCSVSDVASDDGLWKLGLIEMGESSVDGVAEVNTGIDEGAVEIEDDETRDRRGKHLLTITEATVVSSGPTSRRQGCLI